MPEIPMSETSEPETSALETPRPETSATAAFKPSLPLSRATTREARRKQREARVAWQEGYFELLASGFSLQQIADAKQVSVATVRRAVDQAIARRQFDAPDRFIHVQVARLQKALRVADICLERKETRAIGPYLKVVAELNRYYGLGAQYQRLQGGAAPEIAAPPAALAHRAPPSQSIATSANGTLVEGSGLEPASCRRAK